jgi:hypothetical protein
MYIGEHKLESKKNSGNRDLNLLKYLAGERKGGNNFPPLFTFGEMASMKITGRNRIVVRQAELPNCHAVPTLQQVPGAVAINSRVGLAVAIVITWCNNIGRQSPSNGDGSLAAS